MRIEGVTTAFIKNSDDTGDKYLLMKRADNRRFYPGSWAGIGGHMLDNEMTEPETACVREIQEETGIPPEAVNNLKLRYICLSPGHLVPGSPYTVIHYIYFGETNQIELIPTDEGETFWIPTQKVLSKGFTIAMRRIVEHYFTVAVNNESLYVFNETDDSILTL